MTGSWGGGLIKGRTGRTGAVLVLILLNAARKLKICTHDRQRNEVRLD